MRRLKTRGQFQAVLAGDAIARTAHFVIHRARLDAIAFDPSSAETVSQSSLASPVAFVGWIGAIVPKRLAKRAVTRNAIKRQIFCASANAESALPAVAHVVRLRSGFDNAEFISASSRKLKAVLRHELQQLFTKAMTPASAFRQGDAS